MVEKTIKRSDSELHWKSRISPEETKLTITLIFVVFLFVICWGPFAVTMFFDVYYQRPLPRAVEMISLLLGYLNSMCNPILYGLRNSAFKQGFRSLFTRCFPKQFRPRNFAQHKNDQMNAVTVPRAIGLEELKIVLSEQTAENSPT